MRHLGLIGLVLLAGCQAPATVEVPVPVNVPGPTQYVPIPAQLRADCPQVCPALQDGATGAELLEAYRACRARAACRDERIRAIETLQPGS